jgi:uncharacterized protein YndB with AHSA1/START domain
MVVKKSIFIKNQPNVVFAAITEPQEITKHFPLNRIESEAREGGVFNLHGTVNGNDFTDFGIILEYELDRLFSYRYWSTNHGTERSEENEMTIKYLLESVCDGTHLTVTQENIKSEDYRTMMDSVWDALLHQLKTNLDV